MKKVALIISEEVANDQAQSVVSVLSEFAEVKLLDASTEPSWAIAVVRAADLVYIFNRNY